MTTLLLGDETLWTEIRDKAHFWLAKDFYGVDLTPLREEALKSYYRQCTVDAFDPGGAVYKYKPNAADP